MTAKRLNFPDKSVLPRLAKGVHLLQYAQTDTHECFDAFLACPAVVYILSGIKQIKVAQSDFQIRPGELFLIPQGEYVMSEYIAEAGGFKSIMLFLNGTMAKTVLDKVGHYLPTGDHPQEDKYNKAIKIIPHLEEIHHLFLTLERYSKSESPFLDELIQMKFLELIYLLLQTSYRGLILSFLLNVAKEEKPCLADTISEYLYSSVTINRLAMLSGRSVSQFKREFFALHKESPHRWLTCKKLERAAFLLRTSGENIDEIASRSGFLSSAHFARLFKKQYSHTPTEYRAIQAGK